MMVFGIFLVLLALICINVPIAVALAVAAVVGLVATEGAGALVTVALDMYDGSTKSDQLRCSPDRIRQGWPQHGQHWCLAILC